MKQLLIFLTILVCNLGNRALAMENSHGFDQASLVDTPPIFVKDSIRSSLLQDVKVYSNQAEIFVSETPQLKRNHHIEITNSYEIGLLINETNLIGKKLQQISIHFNRRLPNGYPFQVLIYSLQANGFPNTILNKKELLFSKNKANWNEFYLDQEEIKIPATGLAVIIRFFDHSVNNEPRSKISMGLYKTQKQFYLKLLGNNAWIALKTFKKREIGPMIRVSATN